MAIKITIEVSKGAECFPLRIYAQSIQQAIEFVEHWYPSSNARVVFPLDPETFFIRSEAVEAGFVGFKRTENQDDGEDGRQMIKQI